MMDIKEIMNCLPHRYPFILVDKIVHIENDKEITGIKNVTINEHFFEGHFPGNPIMPGVLTVEAMAQVAGILAVKSSGRFNSGVYFMSIEMAKFRRPVVPGDQVRLNVKVIKRRGNIWRFSGTAYVEDKVVSEAEFTAMMSEKEL